MRRKVKTQQQESAILNNQTYMDYYYRLKEMALNVFEWKNLPNSVDERYLELMLYEQGFCIYFNDDYLGENLALGGAIGGDLDIYNVPLRRRAIGANGKYQKVCNNKDSVIIYNNYLRTPTDLTIQLFARRLYELERTIDVNIKTQKTPVIIKSSEQQRLTMKNLYMQYDGNEPFIVADDNLGIDGITAIKIDAPYVADKLQITKHQIWNEALTFLGIENSNADKKERLVADEVGSNYGDVEAQRNVMLNARQQAVKKINKMFGTNIEVCFRSNLLTMVNMENVRDTDLAIDEKEGAEIE